MMMMMMMMMMVVVVVVMVMMMIMMMMMMMRETMTLDPVVCVKMNSEQRTCKLMASAANCTGHSEKKNREWQRTRHTRTLTPGLVEVPGAASVDSHANELTTKTCRPEVITSHPRISEHASGDEHKVAPKRGIPQLMNRRLC